MNDILLRLTPGCLAASAVVAFDDERPPAFTTRHSRPARLLDRAEKLHQRSQPALGEVGGGARSCRQSKERRCQSTPLRKLLADREEGYRSTETKVSDRIQSAARISDVGWIKALMNRQYRRGRLWMLSLQYQSFSAAIYDRGSGVAEALRYSTEGL